MELLELFDEIESPRFAVQLSVVSGFAVLQMALRDSDTLKQLIDALQGSAHNQQKTFEQLVMLLSDNPNPNTMHVHDEAITAYLYVLSLVDTQSTQSAIAQVLQTSNLWWAHRFAESIQKTMKVDTIQTYTQYGEGYSQEDWDKSDSRIVHLTPFQAPWPSELGALMSDAKSAGTTPARRR